MMRRMMLAWALPALVMAADPLAGLEARIQKVLTDWKVPGAAVAVVKDGKPVFVKGFGLRTLGKPEPVDAQTQFGIASLSKAFTATALAILVDEGKLAWDDPVQKHLPAFQLADPLASRELTVRDLLSHRGGLGLGAGDLMLFGGDHTRNDVLERLRHLKPATSFRSAYNYQNNMYVVAGEVIRAASGQPWETFVETRILRPLGMQRANTDLKAQAGDANVATPHSPATGALLPVPYRSMHTAAAAAAVNASAGEMVRWMQLQLGKGDVNGKRVVSARALNETHQPHIFQPNRPSPAPELAPLRTSYRAYGLGWELRDFRGHRMVSHTGGLDGMTCMLGLLPDDGIGVLVLTNTETIAWRALVLEAFDRLLDAPFHDWSGILLQQQGKGKEETKAYLAKQEAERLKDTKPGLPLSGYAGRYRDAWYGDVVVTEQGGALRFDMTRSKGFQGRMTHWHLETFKVDFEDPTVPAALVTFAMDEKGKVTGAKMVPFSPEADFSYDYQDLELRRVR